MEDQGEENPAAAGKSTDRPFMMSRWPLYLGRRSFSNFCFGGAIIIEIKAKTTNSLLLACTGMW